MKSKHTEGRGTTGKGTFAAALGVLTFFVTLGACTGVDDRLGANMIPGNQRMEVEVTSPSNGVKTFLYREDSIPSSRTGRAYFGRTVDANGVFGAQTSSALLQFLPSSRPYTYAEGYGLDPIIDSALIIFKLNATRGDTTRVQRFDVWEIDTGDDTPLHRDSTYYTNFPVEKYKGRKLFEFSHTGKRDVSAKLFPTAAGKEYLYKIVNLPWKEYSVDSVFLDIFHGVYITPAEGSPASAAIYDTDLSESGFEFHVRNHDTLDRSAIYDTLTTYLTFNDGVVTTTVSDDNNEISSSSWASVSINMTEFNYTGSVLGALELSTNGFTDTLPTSTPQSTLYVQAMGGVGTYLRFTDELVQEIRDLKFKIDQTGQKVGKDIYINQAMMRIWLNDSSVETLDHSMVRLGSYLSVKTIAPIPDYQYSDEAAQSQSSEADGSGLYVLPYNGYLNRSNGYYELDITSYVQQLSKVKDDDPEYQYVSPAIFVAPEAYSLIGLGESVLKGFDSDKPVSLRITYTIIEG